MFQKHFSLSELCRESLHAMKRCPSCQRLRDSTFFTVFHFSAVCRHDVTLRAFLKLQWEPSKTPACKYCSLPTSLTLSTTWACVGSFCISIPNARYIQIRSVRDALNNPVIYCITKTFSSVQNVVTPVLSETLKSSAFPVKTLDTESLPSVPQKTCTAGPESREIQSTLS